MNKTGNESNDYQEIMNKPNWSKIGTRVWVSRTLLNQPIH